MCKSFDIHIANGRLFKVKGIGATTCKNYSAVDYCIMSPESFSFVSNLEILPLDPLFRHVHNGIVMEFLTNLSSLTVIETEKQITKNAKG